MPKLYHSPDPAATPANKNSLLVRSATRCGSVKTFYRVGVDGSAFLDVRLERPSFGLARSRAFAVFGGGRGR